MRNALGKRSLWAEFLGGIRAEEDSKSYFDMLHPSG